MPGIGIGGAGLLPVSRLGGVPAPFVYSFDLGDITFTAGMAKRTGEAGVFDAAPIIQGAWDGTGTPDVVSFSRGTLLGNQTQYFYSNFDPYQGSISFWITPEWDGDDGIAHALFYSDAGGSDKFRLIKTNASDLSIGVGDETLNVDVSAWVAGTSYHVVVSWDTKNTLDGTNYAAIYVNDVATFGITTQPDVPTPDEPTYLGYVISAPDAQFEGFFIWRVPLYDGTYGCPMWFDGSGPIDAVAAIYAAGAGADPAKIFGSWDTTFFLPTNSTTGALVTGTGEAWSHPHASAEELDVPFVDDGGLPGTDYAVEFNGTTTVIDCGSDAGLDDVASGGDITVDIWFRADSDGENDSGSLFNKWTSLSNGGYYAQLNAADDQLYVLVECDTTDAVAIVDASAFDLEDNIFVDGKWHLLTVHYEDTVNKRISVAVDGRWASAYDTRTDGVGNYTSDASHNFRIGVQDQATVDAWDGGIAWAEVSDNDRHTAGTDFIPPRVGYNDGNTVAYWPMDEGTGVTVDNAEGTAARDGTIANGSWSAIWAVVGTPEIPQSHTFDASTTAIIVADAANIQDLPDAAFTFDIAFRADSYGESNVGTFLHKLSGNNGWACAFSLGSIVFRVNAATTDSVASFAFAPDSRWHTLRGTFDDGGDRKARLYLDGILQDAGDAAVGNYQSDVGIDIGIGCSATGGSSFDGAIGWVRLSDSLRVATTVEYYIPASRNNPPANDGNAQLLIYMTDGAGTTATDSSGNGYDGTITPGDGVWLNTPDLALEEPGAMVYQQGYNIGSDGADGIYIPVTLTAATDYVIRVPMRYSPNAWPRITLYDVTAVGSIVDFDPPALTGQHSGANNSATMTCAGEVFPANLIGAEIYNVTDGSSGTITAVGGTNQDTITAALAGGTDNDWDTNDEYYIVPAETNWVFNEPIVAHTSANTAYELRITNRNSDGIITVHQAEVIESLLANGDHESAAGNPAILTGWTNNGLDAGDVETDAVDIHAGAQSLEWNPGAVLGEGQYETITTTAGTFLAFAGWTKGDGSDGFRLGELDGTEAVLHNSASSYRVTTGVGATWTHTPMVLRALDTSPELQIEADAIAGDGFSDDFYSFELDGVSLTVTPASGANSLEGDGIRVDGLDQCTVPATAHRMLATSGGIRFTVTPRHGIANSEAFGQTAEYLLDLTEDANNYIRVYRDDAAGGTLTLEVNQAGGGPWTDTDTPAWAADTDANIDVYNFGGSIHVWFDSVPLLAVAGTGFAANFTAAAYFGSEATPDYQGDAVISPP